MSKYFISSDGYSNWFIVPDNKRAEWKEWVDQENLSIDCPEWVFHIDRSLEQITFELPMLEGEPIFKKKPPVMIKFTEREPPKNFPCYIIEEDKKGNIYTHVLVPTEQGYRYTHIDQIRFKLDSPVLIGWTPYE